MLPPPLVEALDWTTLVHVPGSFRDHALAESHTDLLFSARLLFGHILQIKEREEVTAFRAFLERELGPEVREIMTTYAEELIEQGKVAGERRVLLKLLRQRFGELDPEIEQRIATATPEQLETWTARVLSAPTPAEIVAA